MKRPRGAESEAWKRCACAWGTIHLLYVLHSLVEHEMNNSS